MRSAFVGAVAPVALELVLCSSTIDLSTVTAATLTVVRAHDTVTWSAALSNQTATTLTITHEYATDGSDLPAPGTYEVFATMTLPSGTVRTIPQTFPVLPIP